MQVLPLLRSLFACWAFGDFSCNAITNVVLLELLSADSHGSQYRESSIMFDKAEEHLRARYGSVLNVTSVRLWGNDSTFCGTAEENAAFLASRYYYRDIPSAPVIGIFEAIGCPGATESLGDLAREWNATFFISSSAEPSFFNRKRFPTITSFSPFSLADLYLFTYKLFENLRYDKLAIIQEDKIHSSRVSMFGSFIESIMVNFLLPSPQSWSRYRIHANDNKGINDALKDIKSHGVRVVIVITGSSRVRSVMLTAAELHMANGEYVYFAPDLYPNTTFGSLSWDTGNSDGRDIEARTAYHSLFTFSVHEEATAEYCSFVDDVKRISAEKYNYTYAANEEIDPFSTASYYETVIFGQILSEQIANGGSPDDGGALSRAMWNRTFTVLGRDIVISARGYRVSGLVLNQFDPETGIFEPVVKYTRGHTTIKCVREDLDIDDCLANMRVNQATIRSSTAQSQWR